MSSSSIPNLILLLVILVSSSSALFCYSGLQAWEENINNVTLTQCSPTHKCCSFVASLNGNRYECSSKCPAPGERKCGPDPKLGLQDIYYCHCNTHLDEDCKPYLGEKK